MAKRLRGRRGPVVLARPGSATMRESRFTSLLRAAKHYESCFDDAIDRLIPMLEPAMMVILGGLVGVLMLAMYLPLFQIGSVLG